ncbi:MAG: hypothetical protein RLY93_10585 [Sumerlaeia bacterium]
MKTVSAANDSAIWSYQGAANVRTFCHAEFVDLKVVDAYSPPKLLIEKQVEFVVEKEGSRNYLFDVYYQNNYVDGSSDAGRFKEKKFRDDLERLILTPESEPVEGIVQSQRQSDIATTWSDPFDRRASVLIPGSAFAEGYLRLPVSDLLSSPGNAYVEDDSAMVNGHETLCVVARHPHENVFILVYLWLGKEYNYCLLKQRTVMVPDYSRFEVEQRRELMDQHGVTDEFESWGPAFENEPPLTMCILDDYHQVNGQWIPGRIVDYAFADASEAVQTDQRFDNLRSFDDHVRGMNREAILANTYVTEIDIATLKINERIPQDVFTTTLFPEGVPVVNAILRVTSEVSGETFAESIVDQLEVQNPVIAQAASLPSHRVPVPGAQPGQSTADELAASDSSSSPQNALGARSAIAALAAIALLALMAVRRWSKK